MLLGLTAQPGHGKDTVAAMLPGFHRVAFADKLRAVALGSDPIIVREDTTDHHGHSIGVRYVRLSAVVAAYGWDQAKQIPDVRRYLQLLGTEGVRDNLGYDTWADAAMVDVNAHLRQGHDVAITDVHFPNEVAAIRRAGGHLIQIARPGYVRPGNTGQQANHVSNKELAGVDYVLWNDGNLADLQAAVDRMYDHFNGGPNAH